MDFFLGTHEPSWLQNPGPPLFVSARRLRRQSHHRPAQCDWALDSGGFTELAQNGGWTVTPTRYAAEVSRWTDELGRLQWAAPQDWMCEPSQLRKTGLTVARHQQLTIRNWLELETLMPGMFPPVLQGWEPDDYLRHRDAYGAAGVDLEALPLVGLGSICRRQATVEIATLVMELQPLRLHGFGAKRGALRRVGHLLASADSLAWSLNGRRNGSCEHLSSRCANHRHWAIAWRDATIAQIGAAPMTDEQLRLRF